VHSLWQDDQSQDIAEYAVLLSIVLLLVVAVVTAIGTNATTLFSKASKTLNDVLATE
jgi:Flp pilus assembly pilin Flp